MGIITIAAAEGQPLYQFIPTATFNEIVEGYLNCYLKGETYTVREGNADLHRLVSLWHEQNKVIL